LSGFPQETEQKPRVAERVWKVKEMKTEAAAKGRPVGVTIVAVLTLLGSFALGILSLALWLTNFVVGGMGFAAAGESVPITLRNVYVLFPPLLTMTSFALAIATLTGLRSKRLWYAMMIFWAVLVAFFAFWDYGVWTNVGLTYNSNGSSHWQLTQSWQYAAIAVTFLPLAYGAGCLAYFLTAKPKQFFHV